MTKEDMLELFSKYGFKSKIRWNKRDFRIYPTEKFGWFDWYPMSGKLVKFDDVKKYRAVGTFSSAKEVAELIYKYHAII